MFPELYRAHHDLHPEDLPFWLRLAAQAHDPLLELGCGAGRVLLPLAQAGHALFGIEKDAEMLALLRQGLDAPMASRVNLVQADFTRFRLAQQFGLILLPCNTYSTLKAGERADTLRNARAHLRTQGKFAVSMPNPQMLVGLPRRSAPEVEEIFPHPRDGEPVQVSSSWRRTRDEFILEWRYDHLLPDGTVERCSAQVHHQLTPLQTHLEEFRAAGLEIIEMLGDYDFSPYTPEADTLILIAQA